MIEYLLSLFKNKPKFPDWSYGLHCDICNKSFGNAKEHYNYVNTSYNLQNLHKNKIPRLLE